MKDIPPCKGECDHGSCNNSKKDECNLNCACLNCKYSKCTPSQNN